MRLNNSPRPGLPIMPMFQGKRVPYTGKSGHSKATRNQAKETATRRRQKKAGNQTRNMQRRRARR